jgi:hypothetical protein
LITHACPAFVVLAVFLIVIFDDWLSSGTYGGGLKQVVSEFASGIIQDAGSWVPEVSIACIATGLLASWLVRHVMFRLNQEDKTEVCLDSSRPPPSRDADRRIGARALFDARYFQHFTC